jgi:hypothetical protein
MPDTNVNAAPEDGQGQALAPQTQDGQAVEQKSGQEAVGSPGALGDFKTPEDLYKSYQELRKDYTQTKQKAAELAEDAKTMNLLRGDPRFNDWATKTYSEQPQQTPQADKLDELEELGIPTEKLEKLIERRATQLIENHPAIQIAKKTAIDFAFKEAEDNGIKDIRSYKDKIADWYRSNPSMVNLPLEHVYKIVAFDDAPNKVRQEQQQVNQSKRNSSTEGPGMTVAATAPVIRTLGDSLRYELKKK